MLILAPDNGVLFDADGVLIAGRSEGVVLKGRIEVDLDKGETSEASKEAGWRLDLYLLFNNFCFRSYRLGVDVLILVAERERPSSRCAVVFLLLLLLALVGVTITFNCFGGI